MQISTKVGEPLNMDAEVRIQINKMFCLYIQMTGSRTTQWLPKTSYTVVKLLSMNLIYSEDMFGKCKYKHNTTPPL